MSIFVPTQNLKHKVLSLAIAQALLCYTGITNAATIIVDTYSDAGTITGNCELREALSASDSDIAVDGCTAGSAGSDDIVFDNNLSGSTITLGAELFIGSDITVDGDVNGDNTPDISIDGNASSRVFYVNAGSGTIATFNGLTIQNGNAAEGGGIYSEASMLTISNSVVTGNTATNAGGGIYLSNGQLSISNSSITNNSATGGYGSGIANNTGTLIINNSTVSNNSGNNNGSGIFSTDGVLTLTNSTISNNTTNNGGGGMLLRDNTTTLINSTIADNTATYGAGVLGFNTNTISLSNSVIDNNTGENCSGFTLATNTNNHFSDTSCDSDSDGDALLANLANNGGLTQTHLPASTSPLLNAGDQTTCTSNSVTSDQRGINRNDGTCDIGAVEYAASSLQWSSSTASIAENNGTITLTVSRSGNSNGEVSVDYTTSIDSATAPDDFTSKAGTLSFATGITSQTVTIDITNDSQVESSESFTVTLSNAQIVSGADSISLGTNTTSTVTISNDDGSQGGGAEPAHGCY